MESLKKVKKELTEPLFISFEYTHLNIRCLKETHTENSAKNLQWVGYD